MLARPTVKIVSHDNNMEVVMDEYIFYNILTVENRSLVRMSANQKENMAKQEAERIAFKADRAIVPV